MRFISVILSLFFLLNIAPSCFAQDSVKIITDSISTTISTVAKKDTIVQDTTEMDTISQLEKNRILVANNLFISIDTIKKVKRIKDLAYEKNLDSLLRQVQKNNSIKEKQPEHTSWIVSFFLSKITMYFFSGLAILFVLFILYNLFLTQGVFKKRSTKLISKPTDTAKVLIDDYDKLIATAIENKNYRLGLRYLYLDCLKKLANKKLITLTAEKTNYQYVQELYGKSFKNEFAKLTLNYEYVWYGAFEINEITFMHIHNNFKQFNQQL